MGELRAIGGRVLLVDDDPDVRRDYAKLLRSLGFEPTVASDGREAIELLAARSFDVIVTDLAMPGMGGLEFLRAVRAHDLDVPVVLMTGQPGLDSAIEAIEHGAFRYLTKPVTLEQLGEVVRRAIGMHQLARLKREALEVVGADGKQLGDRASLQARFEAALQRLWLAYQPIVRCAERTVFAYEALVRSGEPSLATPAGLFDAARRLDLLHELGRRIRAQVARDAAQAPADALLFVNLHPSDLDDFELLAASAPLSQLAPRVVLEWSERDPPRGEGALSAKVAALRGHGFRLALDNLGAGYAGLSSFARLEPDFVKLDLSLVRRLHEAPRKRSVVRAMVQLCQRELSLSVIGEGVEDPAERDALALEGCDLQQGYLFAPPARGFPPPRFG